MHITSVCRYSRHEKRAPGVRSPVWNLESGIWNGRMRFEERWERAIFFSWKKREATSIDSAKGESISLGLWLSMLFYHIFFSESVVWSVSGRCHLCFSLTYIWLHSYIRRNIYLPFVWWMNMLSSCTCFCICLWPFWSWRQPCRSGPCVAMLLPFVLHIMCLRLWLFLKLCLKLLTLQDCQFWAQGFCPGVSAWAMALNGVVKSFNPHKASFTDSASSMND